MQWSTLNVRIWRLKSIPRDVKAKMLYTAMQGQTAVAAYLKSKQLLLFDFEGSISVLAFVVTHSSI